MFDFKHNHFLQGLLVIAIAFFVILLKSVVILLFIAFLFTVVLHPIVRWLRNRHVPTAVAVFLPILALIGLFVLVGFFIIPVVIEQSRLFVHQLPDYIDKIKRLDVFKGSQLNLNSIQDSLKANIGSFSNALIGLTSAVIKAVVGVITIIVITLYWVGTYDSTKETLLSYVSKKHRDRAADIWARVEKKLVSWVAAEFLLSIVVGVMVWIGAMLLGLPFAGILGLISGLLEIIPTLGPIAAAIPGILLGFTVSLETALGALLMYVLVQQIENHLLAPLLLGRTVKLHPIVIILSLLIGALLYGILGALLAVPAALVISGVVDSYRDGVPKPSQALKKRQAKVKLKQN